MLERNFSIHRESFEPDISFPPIFFAPLAQKADKGNEATTLIRFEWG